MQSGALGRRSEERPWVRVVESARGGTIAWLRELFWPRDASRAYLAVALVALSVPWVYPYPAGIDLPMHLHLFQVLADYSDPESAFRVFYRRDFFTPYAVVYLLGWLFTEIGGVLFAAKMLLSVCVLTVPATLTRWLRVVGADPRLGILGFALVFGYGYIWGFVSFVLSASVSYVYLAELSELLRRPSWPRRAACAGLAVVLFFTHGIGFAFTMLAAGLICILRRGLKTVALDVLHFVPAGTVMVVWRLRGERPVNDPPSGFPGVDRLYNIFSGVVSADETQFAAACVLAAVVVFAVALRPVPGRTAERLVPFLLGLLGAFTLPEFLSQTSLVGTRFVHFVYFFGLGAFAPAARFQSGRRVVAVCMALALVGIGSFHYRMIVFNRELSGLRALQAHVPPRGDVLRVPGESRSEVFGGSAHQCMGGYVAALSGGFLDPDNTQYFQIPIQRRKDVPGPSELRYTVTRGNTKNARKQSGKDAKLVSSTGSYYLLERALTHLEAPGLELVRFGQYWRKPQQDRSVIGRALTVAGQTYARGIGTHAQSALQFHPAPGVKRLRGKYGIDDGGGLGASAVFRIFDGSRRKLLESLTTAGNAAIPFDVSLDGIEGDVFLLVAPSGSVDGAHADWLELEAVP